MEIVKIYQEVPINLSLDLAVMHLDMPGRRCVLV